MEKLKEIVKCFGKTDYNKVAKETERKEKQKQLLKKMWKDGES